MYPICSPFAICSFCGGGTYIPLEQVPRIWYDSRMLVWLRDQVIPNLLAAFATQDTQSMIGAIVVTAIFALWWVFRHRGTLRWIPKMWLVAGMIAGFAVFAGCGVILFVGAAKSVQSSSQIKLQVNKIRFDPSPGHEVYIDFKIENSGRPITVQNWRLSIDYPNDIKLTDLPPRISPFPRHIIDETSGRPKTVDDFERDPIQTGMIRESTFMYSFQGDAKTNLGNRGTVFMLSVEDAEGRKAETRYSLP
jgi:hypothetical protein